MKPYRYYLVVIALAIMLSEFGYHYWEFKGAVIQICALMIWTAIYDIFAKDPTK